MSLSKHYTYSGLYLVILRSDAWYSIGSGIQLGAMLRNRDDKGGEETSQTPVIPAWIKKNPRVRHGHSHVIGILDDYLGMPT